MQQSSTADAIISKIIPLLGALLFITGLGYLIYTSVWSSIDATMRLGIGFFASFLIIGTGLSFEKKLKDFSDIIIGSGLLLFYGTLIYGSRATEIAAAIIPEAVTLITAGITTIAIAYFASLRKSQNILILGLVGAYATPFVIGQNDVWASNLSFNAYLIYFAMINATIFLLGREIAVHKIVPLNLIGLFLGTISIHGLMYSVSTKETIHFLASNEVSVVLMGIIVILSIASLAYSSRFFTEKNHELILSIGYLLPLLWFLIQLSSINSVYTLLPS